MNHRTAPKKSRPTKPASAKRRAPAVPKFVPATTIAAFTGLTPQRVAQLAKEQQIPRPEKKGSFAFQESVRKICDATRARATTRPGAEAEERRANAEAEMAIRRNDREAGELLPTLSVKLALDPIGIILRQKICASSLTESEKDEMLDDIESGILAIDWEKVARDAAKK